MKESKKRRKDFLFILKKFIQDWVCLHFQQICTTFIILTTEIQKQKITACGPKVLVACPYSVLPKMKLSFAAPSYHVKYCESEPYSESKYHKP